MSSNWTKLKRKLKRMLNGGSGSAHSSERSEQSAWGRRKKADAVYSDSVPVKRHYFRRFFYAFSVFFIVFGLIGVIWFVYHEDPNAFGRAEKYYQQGLEAQEQNNLKRALECYEKCLKISPDDLNARLQAVLIYRAQENYARAETLLNEGLSLQPRYEEYYRQMVYLLTEQNRVSEALDYLDNISATYIVVKLNAERPAAILPSPLPGTFTSAVEVKLNVPENATVYYTTDGTAPDRNSSVYSAGEIIKVEKGTVNIRAVAINDAGMPGTEFDVSYRVYNERTKYEFKDPKVEQLVRLVLDKKSGTIYYKDLESVTALDCVAGAAAGIGGSINAMDDLFEMPNLKHLNLNGETTIPSLESLRRLSQLQTLSLDGCNLSDEQFKQVGNIIWLTSLSVQNNQLTTLAPVSSMLSLTHLDASGNQIKAVPTLTRLSALRSLDLSGNALTSIAWISNHKTVAELNLSNNLIPDISPLSTCPALTELNVASNLFQSIVPLAGCTRLETLDISGNDIASLADLKDLTALSNLSAADTKISTVEHLSGLSALTTLNVSGTSVRDFTPLAESKLKNLYAAKCEINDLTTMVMLSSLEMLDVSGNLLNEIGAVALMYQLNVLDVSNNYVVDFSPLLNCTRLRSVNCKGSKVSDSILKQLEKNKVSVIQ
ncbi:MAG: leucine-rich repeat domain-containing protein [Clostridia bacterium]|nr:leucine-rich repeat domain-containing protein [Clostridia bacterium]